jgi:hypothetical protein
VEIIAEIRLAFFRARRHQANQRKETRLLGVDSLPLSESVFESEVRACGVKIENSKKLIAELERRVRATVLIAAKRAIESKWIKHHRFELGA